LPLKKNALIILFLILLIANWAYYKALNRPNRNIVLNEENNQTPSSLELKSPSQLPAVNTNSKLKNMPINSEDQNFEVYDEMEKKWLLKIQTIISADKYARYLELKNQNENEKLKAYKEFHHYLRQKYGDKFSYNISEDQSIREKEINQKYLTELAKLIGPEKFIDYTTAKDELNEEMIRNNKESIQIEF
jgi:hypothetical protein